MTNQNTRAALAEIKREAQWEAYLLQCRRFLAEGPELPS